MTLKPLADSFYGRGGAIWAAAIVAVLILLPAALPSNSYAQHLLFSVFVFAVLGHGWNLLAGYAGLLSFGQQVFIGLGGFAQALLFYYSGVSVWVAWPLAGIASLLFAWILCLPLRESGSRRRSTVGIAVAVVLWLLYEWLIAAYPGADVFQSHYIRRVAILLLIFLGALPLLRLQGAYFAIATWLVAEAVLSIFSGWNVAGAGGGMQLRSSVTSLQMYYAALALLVVTTAIIWRWMRSAWGLALTAVRDDEEAARTSGVDVSKVKAAVFLFSALITGLAAGLHFMDVVIITPPSAFAISWAVYIVFVVVSGGIGTVAGPVIGAVIFIVVDRLLGAVAGQGLLVLGILSIVVILVLPRGVMGVVHDIRHPYQRRRRTGTWRRIRSWVLGSSAADDRRARTELGGVVAAYLLPASPLLSLCRKVPRYGELTAAMRRVARDIEELAPDALVIYSSRWYAVLDQLWQGRPHMSGVHVDENWHEFGEMHYDITTDVSLARNCARAADRAGIPSKLVNYANFPVDSATISANTFVNPDGVIPSVIVANNLYFDARKTRELGEVVAAQAVAQGKRVVVLVLGGLSGGEFRDERAPAEDALSSATDDHWNRRILKAMEARDVERLMQLVPDFVKEARADMGFKHFSFAMGTLGGRLGDAKTYAYGPQYGAGAAVVRLF